MSEAGRWGTSLKITKKFSVSTKRSQRALLEAVAHARFGDDEAGAQRVLLDLASEARHVDAEVLPRVAEPTSPHRSVDLLVREGAPVVYESKMEGPASPGGLRPFPEVSPTIQIRKESYSTGYSDFAYLDEYNDEEEEDEYDDELEPEDLDDNS